MFMCINTVGDVFYLLLSILNLRNPQKYYEFKNRRLDF